MQMLSFYNTLADHFELYEDFSLLVLSKASRTTRPKTHVLLAI